MVGVFRVRKRYTICRQSPHESDDGFFSPEKKRGWGSCCMGQGISGLVGTRYPSAVLMMKRYQRTRLRTGAPYSKLIEMERFLRVRMDKSWVGALTVRRTFTCQKSRKRRNLKTRSTFALRSQHVRGFFDAWRGNCITMTPWIQWRTSKSAWNLCPSSSWTPIYDGAGGLSTRSQVDVITS